MIKFSLTRDQARLIEQHCLPYMTSLASAQLQGCVVNDSKYLNQLIIVSLLSDVDIAFKRKLLTTTNKFSFSLSPAHASAFYVYLMKRPIDTENVYAHNFRQQLCNELHQQLFVDKPSAQLVPAYETDFEWDA